MTEPARGLSQFLRSPVADRVEIPAATLNASDRAKMGLSPSCSASKEFYP
jgi:hypothetical protein